MNNYEVDREKWARLSIFEQMGNIYSEVGRTFTAKKRNDRNASDMAAARAFDLFDATAEVLSRKKSPRTSEVLRARELFADEYLNSSISTLDSYFLQFALVARRKL